VGGEGIFVKNRLPSKGKKNQGTPGGVDIQMGGGRGENRKEKKKGLPKKRAVTATSKRRGGNVEGGTGNCGFAKILRTKRRLKLGGECYNPSSKWRGAFVCGREIDGSSLKEKFPGQGEVTRLTASPAGAKSKEIPSSA